MWRIPNVANCQCGVLQLKQIATFANVANFQCGEMQMLRNANVVNYDDDALPMWRIVNVSNYKRECVELLMCHTTKDPMCGCVDW